MIIIIFIGIILLILINTKKGLVILKLLIHYLMGGPSRIIKLA